MSVRIYQLSKEIDMENSELISLLRERGYEVKSASSTVDNISAESIREEFKQKTADSEKSAKEDQAETSESKATSMKPPAGAIVRSREDIERERREREEAQQAAKKAAAAVPPAVKAPPMPGKMPPRIGKTPPPVGKPPARVSPPVPPRAPQGKAAPSIPPVAVPPKVVAPKKPVVQAAPVKGKGPAPVSAPKAHPMPPKASGAGAPPSFKPMPKGPGAPKSLTPPIPHKHEAAESESQESAAPEGKSISIKPPIVVRDFAVLIGKKPFQLISELMEMNIFASMNQVIEEDVAKRIATKHGFNLEVKHRGEGQQQNQQQKKKKSQKSKKDDSELQEPRPPIVCILGHVDHGKTTLLDTIRHSNVVSGEAGGITQHVASYQVERDGQKITFIDTPGHAAFSNMRARGANVTDIAILVVAADDGFMPQTDEALAHAQKAGVPIVVAINKMDMPGANPDRVYRQMQERNISPEAWGGEVLTANISALKGEGIDDLLDQLLLQAEVTEGISANPKCKAEGVILEAQKEVGRGSTASAIITAGTLKRGDALLCGTYYCKVRSIIDDKGKTINSASPSTPVKIVGWSGTPGAGDEFATMKNERDAKRAAEDTEHRLKMEEAQNRSEDSGPASLDDLFAAIAQKEALVYKVIVKADVYGTAEALAFSLEQIHSDKISLEVVDMGVGAVTKNDVVLCSASEASIVAFNVGLENGVSGQAKHDNVGIIQHNIIYELIEQVKDAMADQLEPELRENKTGASEVRAVFPLAKSFVAGCMVTEGKITRHSKARLLRKGKILQDGRIGTLKRFKDDATEVRAGYECGIQIEGVSDYKEGDIIETYEILKIKASL